MAKRPREEHSINRATPNQFLSLPPVCIPVLRWSEGEIVCRVRSKAGAPEPVECKKNEPDVQSQSPCDRRVASDSHLYLRLFTVMQHAAAYLDKQGFHAHMEASMVKLTFASKQPAFTIVYNASGPKGGNFEELTITSNIGRVGVERAYGSLATELLSRKKAKSKDRFTKLVFAEGEEYGIAVLTDLIFQFTQRIYGTLIFDRTPHVEELADYDTKMVVKEPASLQFVQTKPGQTVFQTASRGSKQDPTDLLNAVHEAARKKPRLTAPANQSLAEVARSQSPIFWRGV